MIDNRGPAKQQNYYADTKNRRERNNKQQSYKDNVHKIHTSKNSFIFPNIGYNTVREKQCPTFF